jgi:superfamily I DNA/RNA helicase
MMTDAAIADDIGSRFDHVLVDEYQNTDSCNRPSCWP